MRVVTLLCCFSFIFGVQAVFSYNPSPTPAPARQSSIAVYSNQIPGIRVVSYNFLLEKELYGMTAGMFPNVRAYVNDNKKTAMFSGDRSDLDKLESVIKRLDLDRKTIEYSTYVIEVNHNELQKLGLEWQTFIDDWKLGKVSSPGDFLKQISFLFKNGEAKILANPVIVSLVDEEATIKVGDKIPYALPVESASRSSWQLQYMDSGLELRIKGKIVSEDIVQTDINTVLSSVKQWKALQSGEYPVLSNREVKLHCQVKNKETLVLGGLTNSSNRVNYNKLPFLADLPFIGGWFVSQTIEKEDSEIVFLLTPEIKSL